VFVLYIAVQVLANNIIGPWIMGRAVGLHPLAIILAIMVGGLLLGLPGIVLAIPVAACLNIILEEWVMDPEHRLEKLIMAQEAETPPEAP
jgi:predicted PurR-regulated permease PerM